MLEKLLRIFFSICFNHIECKLKQQKTKNSIKRYIWTLYVKKFLTKIKSMKVQVFKLKYSENPVE